MSDRRVDTRWRKCRSLERAIARERLEGRLLFSGVVETATRDGVTPARPDEVRGRDHCRRKQCATWGRGVERLENRRLLSAAAVPRGGTITTLFPTNGAADADAVAVQQDGKFVVAGTAKDDLNGNAALVRYNPNGTLDGTFGTGGKVFLPRGQQIDDVIYAVAIQGDGKIIAAGDDANVDGLTEYLHFLLVRLNSNGTEDQSFDSNVALGIASLGRTVFELKGLLVQPDGKIVVAGSEITNTGNPPLVVVRFNADGTLDQQFGSGGFVGTSLVAGQTIEDVTTMTRQADGKILLGGYTVPAQAEGIKFGILRLNADGSLDQNFGSGGRVATAFTSDNDYIQALSVGSDGKIVAAGWLGEGGAFSHDAVARYEPDGSLDPTFGQGGKETFHINGNDDLNAAAVEPDGSIVAAGLSSDATGYECMTLVRLRPDGSFDPAFGTGGKAITHIGKYYSGANAMALLPDGRIVAAGEYAAGPLPGRGPSISTNDQFAVGVFTADGKNDPTFGVPYDINHDASVDFADLLILGQHFGKPGTFAYGDLNGDGTVGMDDFLLLSQNYGNTSAVPAGAAIAADSEPLRRRLSATR